jgi:CrcB protein
MPVDIRSTNFRMPVNVPRAGLVEMSLTTQFLYVALGGMIGAVLRFGAYLVSSSVFGTDHRIWVTAFVNILGSFLLGALLGYAQQWSMDQRMSLLLMIGLLGSFTTFSTFALESAELIIGGRMILFGIYFVASNLLSILAAWGGLSLVKNIAG